MEGDFINQLFTTENRVNRVQSQDDSCPICLESYGTITDKGAIECEIRLPCNPKHTLGSMCAFTWFESNDTCPLCRKKLFSLTDRLIVDDDDDGDDDDDDDDEYLADIVRLGLDRFSWNSRELRLAVHDLAVLMAQNLNQREQAQGFCLASIAGTAIYIATHLLNYPLSSWDISNQGVVDEGLIQLFYRCVYAERDELIDPGILEVLARNNMEGTLAFLPPPDPDVEFVVDEDEELGYFDWWRPMHTVNFFCELAGQRLGLEVPVIQLAQQTAKNYFMRRDGVFFPSDNKASAVGMFVALHLLGLDTTYEEIERVIDVPADTVRKAYHRLYPHRDRVVNSVSLEIIGKQDMSRALETLTPLLWPPLDPEIADNEPL